MSSGAHLTVRPAEQSDAEAIARVHVRSWQVAYRGLLPDPFLDGLQWQQRHETWSERLREPAVHGRGTYVICVDDDVHGFASVGPCRDDDRQSPEQWELYGIYLAPELWRLGHGRTLLEAALASVPPHVRDVSLWVLTGNARARSFYESHGFVVDETERSEVIGGLPVTEVRYVLHKNESH